MFGEGRTINVTGNAQYIEYLENNYVNGAAKQQDAGDSTDRMSDELKAEEGQMVLKNLQTHGVLDENFYVLAYQISIALNIKEVWKVFSKFWKTSPNALRAAYNRGMEQKKTMEFLEEISPILKI